MHGVIRFLDTKLLPASSPEDYPKVIKSGIDEEGQHPKSPKITGPCGIATLLHRVGRSQLLERLLDVENTNSYDLRLRTGQKYIQDVYVTRRGCNVEIGFINFEDEWAQHGVRYIIEPEPRNSPYPGKWIPVSTSDLSSAWGGSDIWVRGQGAAVAKAIWFHKHFNRSDIEVSWSGMTEEESKDLAEWLDARAAVLNERDRVETEEYEARKATYGDEHYRVESEMGMKAHYMTRMVCRAQCGDENPKFSCSKCKMARYCSLACQTDDWKYHKTYCGTEKPIPEKYL